MCNNERFWLAWCGGIFEGEGHGRLHEKNGYYYSHIEIDNTELAMLEKFQNCVGVGSVRPHDCKRKDGYNRKPNFRYSATCKNARKVAEMILPFVVSERKRNQLFKVINNLP